MVKKECPELIRDGKIFLGSFPKDASLTWENAGDCVQRMVAYAVIRDKLRAQVKNGKKVKTADDGLED